jgi:hypothetical protein
VCCLVDAGASGDWVGHDDEIAACQDGVWGFIAPATGWRAYVVDAGLLCVWSGAGWNEAVPAPGLLQNLALLGIALSENSSSGSIFGGYSLSEGSRNAMAKPLPTSVPFPVSGSTPAFLHEELGIGASELTVTFARVLRVYG